MADITNVFVADNGISLCLGFNDDVEIFTGPNNPSVNPGEAAPTGSLWLRTSGNLYMKVGPGDTEWFELDTKTLLTTDLPVLQVRRSTALMLQALSQMSILI